MDRATLNALEFAAISFGLLLPLSAYGWTVCFLAGGFLRRPIDQPFVFRGLARVARLYRSAPIIEFAAVIVAIPFMALGSFVSAFFLARTVLLGNAIAPLSVVVAVAYYPALGIWLAVVVRAIFRRR